MDGIAAVALDALLDDADAVDDRVAARNRESPPRAVRVARVNVRRTRSPGKLRELLIRADGLA